MIKKKEKFDVTTYTHQLTDNAVDDAGKEAYATFTREEIEVSNDNLIPFHATDRVVVKRTIEEVDVDDPTCQNGDEPTPTPGEPKIVGADNTSVKQGLGFDLMAGVKAYDADGNEIPFTVNPTELNKCDLGPQSFTYSAEGVTKVRTIEVTAIADPTISGLTPLEVEVGEEFDPLDGVSAKDGNGKSVEVTVEQPTQYITLIDVSNYTAPSNTPLAKVNEWERSQGQNLIVESSGVVAYDGTTPYPDATDDYGYFDGNISDISVAVPLVEIEGVVENGAGVWFYSDGNDPTKFISDINSEGLRDYLPTTVFFERLVVKQEVE